MIHKLEVDGVRFQIGDKTILSGVYLKCETGKITGLLGRNGSGKSCLLEIISGTITCEKSVRIDHISYPALFRIPGLIHFLPQYHFIPAFLSVRRVFQDFELDFDSFIKRFPEFVTKYKERIADLSGGEKRLVELYCVIAAKSYFALLDEPFTHLSPVQIQKVVSLIEEKKSEKGFLITDHLYREVTGVCDDLYVLSDGVTHYAENKQDMVKYGYAKA